MADFESLIELITSTTQPTTWDEVGGGHVREFRTNLALTVSQTQQVHGKQNGMGGGFGVPSKANRMASKSSAKSLAKTSQEDIAETSPPLLDKPGYWNPAIVTGADGKAKITVTLPGQSTTWVFLATGITAGTLAGETTQTLTARKELFGELKLPAAFTDGDEPQVGVTVHNALLNPGPIDVTLKTILGNRVTEETKRVEAKAKGIFELAFKTNLHRAGTPPSGKGEAASSPAGVAFELTVKSAGAADVLRRSVPLLPYGMPAFAAASGSAGSDTIAWIESPKEMPIESPSLQIIIGPTVERTLLDIVQAVQPDSSWYDVRQESLTCGSPIERAASDLLAAWAYRKPLPPAATPRARRERNSTPEFGHRSGF